MQVDILKMKNDVYRLAFCEKNLDWAKQIWDRLNALTLGKDGEVTAMLQSMTMAGMHLEREAAVQLQLAELQRQFTASQAQVELHRSALQTTKEEHRSALAESALLLATQQEQAEELERLLAAEQRAGRLLTAKLQDQEKLLTEINRYRLMAAQQVAPSSQGLQLQLFSFEVVTVSPQGDVGKRETKQAEYLTFNLPLGNTLDLVHIPAGQFLMGSPDGEGNDQEKPQHWVTVPDFYLGKYPVTQAQWRSISSLSSVKLDLKPDPAKFKGDLCPVEQISWREAIEFCSRLSQLTGEKFCLPSEAEWEYACRAGTSTPFHFGQTISTRVANYDGSSVSGQEKKEEYRQKTTDVGSLNAANGFGLYDMHGNVWEWCADCWHDNYQGAPTDGSAWMSKNDNDYHLLRGGSWIDNPRHCCSACRRRNLTDIYSGNVGFRVVYAPVRTL